MTRDIETLCTLWREVHSNPAWLSVLAEQLNLDTDDEACLIELDEAFLRDMKAIARQWRKELQERMAWSRDGVDNDWAKGRRKEYLTQAITSLGGSINDLAREKADDPVIQALNHLRIAELAKLKSRHFHELSALYQNRPERLDESHIAKARAVPLEQLVETKHGMMLCPLHDDTHPSMLVKNGFGYCFSCCGYLDSIGYMMRVRGLNFREAVENLQRR